jgi:hypothetical protein
MPDQPDAPDHASGTRASLIGQRLALALATTVEDVRAREAAAAPLRGRADLHERWLLGLVWNPALPASVLKRLLAVDEFPVGAGSWLAQRDLVGLEKSSPQVKPRTGTG